jgi:hypothetical protein
LLDLLDGEDWWLRLNPLIASADVHLDEGFPKRSPKSQLQTKFTACLSISSFTSK